MCGFDETRRRYNSGKFTIKTRNKSIIPNASAYPNSPKPVSNTVAVVKTRVSNRILPPAIVAAPTSEIHVQNPVIIAVINPTFASLRIVAVICQSVAPRARAASSISRGTIDTAEIAIPMMIGRARMNWAMIMAVGV